MTFDMEKFRIKPGQMDLFDNAPYTPMLERPAKNPATKLKLPTSSSRVGKKLNAARKSVDLVQKTIEESVEILRNLGCEYIVMMGNGRVFEHGELPTRLRQQAAPVAPKKPKRASPGTFSHHYKPIIENLAIGTVAFVPFKTSTGVNLSVPQLNSAITAWMARQWGAESSTTHINRKLKGIEVLRLK